MSTTDSDGSQHFRGGARVGWLWNGPATLDLGRDDLTIKAVFRGAVTIARSEVSQVRPIRVLPVAATGVRIRHTKPDTPPMLIFWVYRLRPTELLDAFTDLGYPTD